MPCYFNAAEILEILKHNILPFVAEAEALSCTQLSSTERVEPLKLTAASESYSLIQMSPTLN